MKHRDLIQRLEAMGCVLVRHGRRHDWYENPKTNRGIAVPRHSEIKDWLARSIIRSLGGE